MIDTMPWGDYPIHKKAISIFAHHRELFDVKTIAELKEARHCLAIQRPQTRRTVNVVQSTGQEKYH